MRISSLNASELIDMICNTHASSYIRDEFERMDVEELRQMAKDAMELVVERMVGGD
jgi:hypothetical protein